ncbi:IPExxxVDY family protein [Flavobacterium branchiophilum]|nr:IPExxxVDY family protein [Flavobacterium branchiophilum]
MSFSQLEILYLPTIYFDMAVHKLEFDDFEEIDYFLLAIHTHLEDYRLAYFINQALHINLSKSAEEVAIRKNNLDLLFEKFDYFDENSDWIWTLIQNKCITTAYKKQENFNLFDNEIVEETNTNYLLPELKTVSYFLRINDEINLDGIEKIVAKLSAVERIAMVYQIDKNKVKNKNNLIF